MAKTMRMSSKFEYEIIPPEELTLDMPVVQIVEMNDGYQMLLDAAGADALECSYDEYLQVNEFKTLRDYLVEEMDCELGEDGELVFWITSANDGDRVGTQEEFWAHVLGPDSSFLGKGVLRAKKLTGTYTDPNTLFWKFFRKN